MAVCTKSLPIIFIGPTAAPTATKKSSIEYSGLASTGTPRRTRALITALDLTGLASRKWSTQNKSISVNSKKEKKITRPWSETYDEYSSAFFEDIEPNHPWYSQSG